jgi:hypothetical protein
VGDVAVELAGVWLLEGGEGVLLLLADGWYAVQVAGGPASAGHYGVDGDRFLLDPVVASDPADIGRVRTLGWSFEGDALVLRDGDTTRRWQRETSEVVTGLGAE